MSEEPDIAHLAQHGFTIPELRALAEGLSFAVTLAEAGETGVVGDLGADAIDWTPEKRRVFSSYLHAYREWTLAQKGDSP